MGAALWLGHSQQVGALKGLFGRKPGKDQRDVLDYFCFGPDFYILKVSPWQQRTDPTLILRSPSVYLLQVIDSKVSWISLQEPSWKQSSLQADSSHGISLLSCLPFQEE